MTRSFATAVLLAGALLVGCSTIREWSSATQRWYSAQQVKWRENKEKEYKYLASLPPAQMIKVSNHELANCAKASHVLFNEAHVKMRAYIAFSENCREYTGYVNDIQYHVEVEKMSVQDASVQVRDAILAVDAKHPEGERIWPKVQRGCAAAKILGTQDEWSQISALSTRRYELSKSLRKISKDFSDRRDKLRRAKKKHQISDESHARAVQDLDRWESECTAVEQQVSDAGRCISFMQDQYSRNVELENYAK